MIRSNCFLYIHSQSQCGTAPSLVEAMNLNLPVICFDVPTNRETTENKSIYFKDKSDLESLIVNLNPNSINQLKLSMFQIAKKRYNWNRIASLYKRIFDSL